MIVQEGTTLESLGKGIPIDWDKVMAQFQTGINKPSFGINPPSTGTWPGISSKVCPMSLCPNGKARDENCQCPVHSSWGVPSSFWDKISSGNLTPVVKPYGPKPWTGPGIAPTFPAPPSALAIAQKKLKEAEEAKIKADAEKAKAIADGIKHAADATAARESARALREKSEFNRRLAETRAAEAAAAAQIATDVANRQAQIIKDIDKDKIAKYIPYAAAAVGLGLAFYMLKK